MSAMVIVGFDHADEIWRALAEHGIDPRSCHLSASSLPGYSWQIIHQPSSYVVYGTLEHRRYHLLRYSFDKRNQLVPVSHSLAYWSEVVKVFEKWADEAKAYVGVRQREFDLKAASRVYMSADNSGFTVAEQHEIASQLRTIRISLQQNFKLSAEQMKRVNDRLDEADEASRRLGRKDWILLFSGAVFSLILSDAITPDIAQHIFMIVIHGAEHLFLPGIGSGLGGPEG